MLSRYYKKLPDSKEECYYLDIAPEHNSRDLQIVHWLLSDTQQPANFSEHSFLEEAGCAEILEVGPRLSFETPWCSALLAILQNCGVASVRRIEYSTRLGLPSKLMPEQREELLGRLYDRMTHMPYEEQLTSFDHGIQASPVQVIPLLEQGKDALRAVNVEHGLGMDEQDIDYWYDLFVRVLERNPTDVGLFGIGVGGSEHSRHPWFRGKQVIDGAVMPETLMDILRTSWQEKPGNTIRAFAGSAIQGFWTDVLTPVLPGQPSVLTKQHVLMHFVTNVESHNHPCLWEPYEGAATGKGGGIRDIQVFGRGARVIAGGAGYCVGNLHIPGYPLLWEKDGWSSSPITASPLRIFIRASDGASDYANCFGEPIIYGFARTFGCELPDGYRSWFKPVMLSMDVGHVQDAHVEAGQPEEGMLVVQIGGPGYRIGVGGGSASSMPQGQNDPELDFNSVQRGNPEMEQRLERCVRACIALGDSNPVIKMNDLGAGGISNAIAELVSPAGANIEVQDIPVGDNTLSVLEKWGNEAQERNALLVWSDQWEQFRAICERERLPCAVVGEVTGNGNLVLYDKEDDSTPVDLPLAPLLDELPQKTFELSRIAPKRTALELPDGLTIREALERVLRLPAVASKRWLVTKADRSVGGLVAQQQCVGPNHIPVSDYAVVADSHFGLTGKALTVGEQPVKGLISPEAMARLAMAEAVLNMAGAKITSVEDVKVLANWMVAAKMEGEGVWLRDAACALRDACRELGAQIGGKDSLSMAALAQAPDGTTQTVKAPGQLVISAEAPMEDITKKVTPELKHKGHHIFHIPVNPFKHRLGGSALAQVYGQVGDECPDVDDLSLVRRIFEAVQELIARNLVCAVHDVSDGGLICTMLEMAFAGNMGLAITLETSEDEENPLAVFLSEEPGLVLEVADSVRVSDFLCAAGVPADLIVSGQVLNADQIVITRGHEEVLHEKMTTLRQIWEETSTQLDRLQATPETAEEEARVIAPLLTPPPYKLTFSPVSTPEIFLRRAVKPKAVILREQGSNGDAEMAAAFYLAGFEPVDVMMSDLQERRITLDEFQMLALVGGFSYKDVPESAKGWAAAVLFNEYLREQFERFYMRPDTLSLGVCNGCQVMPLFGWVPWQTQEDREKVRFLTNKSARFESRFPAVRVLPSTAILTEGMEGSTLGVWSSHKEGRLGLPETVALGNLLEQKLVPFCYVDEEGNPTEKYPSNPNGSPGGVAALCTPDGRHLATMVHVERTFQKWHWPWMSEDWQQNLQASPWLKMFQNAYNWCTQS